MSVERSFHIIGVFEGDGDHWIAIGRACDELLARLEKFHERKPAPAPQDTGLIKRRDS
jgi:hypothetical protein